MFWLHMTTTYQMTGRGLESFNLKKILIHQLFDGFTELNSTDKWAFSSKKSLSFAKSLNKDGFKASNGWLKSLRHDIAFLRL